MTNPFASDDDKPDDRSADASTGSGSLPSYNAYSGGDATDDGAPLTGATDRDAYPGRGSDWVPWSSTTSSSASSA